jgi:hypothetical protein
MDIDINLLKIKSISNSPNYKFYYNKQKKCRVSIDNANIIKIEEYDKNIKIAFIKNKNFTNFLTDLNKFLLNKKIIKKTNIDNFIDYDKKYGLLNKIYFSIKDSEYELFKKNININIKIELDLLSVNLLDETNYILKYDIVNIDNIDCYINNEIDEEHDEYPEPYEIDLIKDDIVNKIKVNKSEIEKLYKKNEKLYNLYKKVSKLTDMKEIEKLLNSEVVDE